MPAPIEARAEFAALFRQATGNDPFGFQRRFARTLPPLVRVPTGAGKTAMAALGWLWRRRFAGDEAIRAATPRRLVYCLPMRVLVEQTRNNAADWLQKLGLEASDPSDDRPAEGWASAASGSPPPTIAALSLNWHCPSLA
jgi:CRISPR-associated endonuclease/helicase Cas3